MPVAEKATRTNVTIDRDLWKAVKHVAAEQEKTVGEVMDELVQEYLKKARQSRGS